MKTICQNCGKEFIARDDQVIRGRGKYCSRECYQVHWKKDIAPSLFSRQRKRIAKTCVTCGKEFEIIPAWLKRAGEGKYCSLQCKYAGQRKVKGIDHPLHKEPAHLVCKFCGKKYTTKPALKDKSKFCSRQCQGCWQSRHMSSPSSIEIIINTMLKELRVEFVEQAQIGQYLCDFLLPANNLVIETDGTYWHSLPNSKAKDKRKDSYLSNHGYSILRLPEKLIMSSPEQCRLTILNRLKPC
jgi:very-short-patch-repair endonuclease